MPFTGSFSGFRDVVLVFTNFYLFLCLEVVWDAGPRVLGFGNARFGSFLRLGAA